MKRLSLLVVTAVIGAALFAHTEEPTPKKHDASWHQVVLVNFKEGKVDEAKKIISHFASASDASGTHGPQQFWFVTGSYDMMLIWEMEGGPSDLEWVWSPDGVKWWKYFVEQEGSQEAAQKIQDDYNNLIASTTSQILRKDR